ncbi:MAG: hypothetical protein ACXWMO_13255 [Syntrophales bacterium]
MLKRPKMRVMTSQKSIDVNVVFPTSVQTMSSNALSGCALRILTSEEGNIYVRGANSYDILICLPSTVRL